MTAYTVNSGQSSSGLLISTGDTLVVAFGGAANAAMVVAGGEATISGHASGGLVSGVEPIGSGANRSY